MSDRFYFNGHYNTSSQLVVESVTTSKQPTSHLVFDVGDELDIIDGTTGRRLTAQPPFRFNAMPGQGQPPAIELVSQAGVFGPTLTLRFNADGILTMRIDDINRDLFRVPNIIGPKNTDILITSIEVMDNILLFQWGRDWYYTYANPESGLTLGKTVGSDAFEFVALSDHTPPIIALRRNIAGAETTSCALAKPTILWRETVDQYDLVVADKVARIIAATPFVTR